MPEKENYDLSKTNLQSELGQGLNAADVAAPKTAGDEIRRALSGIQTTIREQQLSADKQLQSLLAQASQYIEGTQRLDQIVKAMQQVSPMVQTDEAVRSNLQQLSQALDQISGLTATHQAKVSGSVTQSLQDSVSSLAQASVAMAENQAFTQVADMVRTWKANLAQMAPPGQPVQ